MWSLLECLAIRWGSTSAKSRLPRHAGRHLCIPIYYKDKYIPAVLGVSAERPCFDRPTSTGRLMSSVPGRPLSPSMIVSSVLILYQYQPRLDSIQPGQPVFKTAFLQYWSCVTRRQSVVLANYATAIPLGMWW